MEQSTGSTLPTDLTAVLGERGSRYGAFVGHADVTVQLKTVIQTELSKRSKQLDPDQMEALDMICHKIGRIVNGDADYDDSWRDIAGYSMLVCDRLNGITR
jgi:hypothetical protein